MALSRNFHGDVFSSSVVGTEPTNRKFKPENFRRYTGYEAHDFVIGFQNDRAISIGERKRTSIRQRPGHTGIKKTERRIELSQRES
jgi:hypothetical protein